MRVPTPIVMKLRASSPGAPRRLIEAASLPSRSYSIAKAVMSRPALGSPASPTASSALATKFAEAADTANARPAIITTAATTAPLRARDMAATLPTAASVRVSLAPWRCS